MHNKWFLIYKQYIHSAGYKKSTLKGKKGHIRTFLDYLDCRGIQDIRDVTEKKIYEYKLPSKKHIRKKQQDRNIQQNTLKLALKQINMAYIEFDQFKKELSNTIYLANEGDYNITILSIEVKKLSNIRDKFGEQLSLKLMKSILLVVKKFIRQFSAISYNEENKILILLPKIHLNMAKIAAEKVQSYFKRISQEVDLEIKLASYPEDGYNEKEILAMLEIGIEIVKEKFIP